MNGGIKKILPLLLLLPVIHMIIALDSCAVIVPPAGGPKDTIPPVLVKANPVDSSLDFNTKRIVFTFDEFVDVQDPQNNLMISPLPKISPVVEARLNTVTVRIKDSLEPNTTYTYNFGNTIKDYNEGNVLKNFTYAFSTGHHMDSLRIKGHVVLAESGKTDTTLVVMLHTSADDSAVVKDRPRYLTKLDGKGDFVFTNLPAKTFYVYALKDEGNQHRYTSQKQVFAFADRPVPHSLEVRMDTLYAYSSGTISGGGNITTGLPDIQNVLVTKGKKNQNDKSDKRLKYTASAGEGQQDLLTNFNISFDQPLRHFDTSKIKVTTDSSFQPLAKYSFSLDSLRREIEFHIDWTENTVYHIILDKDFADDSSGKKLLKTDTINIKSKKLSDYGSLQLKLHNLDMSRNPVLLFISNEALYKSYPLAGPDFSQTLFLPGDYELRILYDENKNGRWDPGSFFGKHKQPEKVKLLDRKISIKANWKNEFDLAL